MPAPSPWLPSSGSWSSSVPDSVSLSAWLRIQDSGRDGPERELAEDLDAVSVPKPPMVKMLEQPAGVGGLRGTCVALRPKRVDVSPRACAVHETHTQEQFSRNVMLPCGRGSERGHGRGVEGSEMAGESISLWSTYSN